MSMSASKLKDGLAKLMDPNNAQFAGFPSSASAAATAYASAYATYAADAADNVGNALISGNTAAFASALSWSPSNVSATSASLFGAAFLAFWTGAVFGFTTPQPGEASATLNLVIAAPQVAVVAALTSSLATQYAHGADAAQAMADALHSGVSSIITSCVGLTPTGAPITVPGTVS